MTPFTEPEQQPPTAVCVFGGPVDDDGVCVEHGETACVIGVLAPEHAETPAPPASRRSGR